MRVASNLSLILTCEHAGNEIPGSYEKLFLSHQNLLKSHRGVDIGAYEIAQMMQEQLGVDLFATTTSRLLIDTNRYLTGNGPFSEVTDPLPLPEKQQIIDQYYKPHWKKIRDKLDEKIRGEKTACVQVAVHSMTDQLDGQKRTMQLALLFDPKRTFESIVVEHWLRELRGEFPSFEIAENKPYRGDDEGMTSELRTVFTDQEYAGIELELNQALLQSMNLTEKKRLASKLGTALKIAFSHLTS